MNKVNYCRACNANANLVSRLNIAHTCGRATIGDSAYTAPFADARKLIYTAGKVTGLPYGEVALKFKNVQTYLEMQGYHVINPTNLCSADMDWQLAMRLCIRALTTADAVYMLPCWQNSTGAKLEHELATKLGIEIIYAKP